VIAAGNERILDSGFPYRMLPYRMLRYRYRGNDGVLDTYETVNMPDLKVEENG
jgi:hypothetical protein